MNPRLEVADIRAPGIKRPDGGLLSRFFGDLRNEVLRFVALAILLGNLLLGDGRGDFVLTAVVVTYLAVSVSSALAVLFHWERRWTRTFFVVMDALAVAVVLYTQLLQSPIDHAHNLTTAGLVVAFVLLNHVGLTSDRYLVIVFSAIVLLTWVAALAIMALRHDAASPGALLSALVNRDLGLAASFAFTSFAVYIVARDHGQAREEAANSDRRRGNLARFFSPHVVTQLEDASPAVKLDRRRVAVMFVDLRGFTAFAEAANPRELTHVLSRYREITAGIISRHGGTIDKYLGDGIMAVFGHPTARNDDADRALRASLELVSALTRWKQTADRKGLPALPAGIGLHFGTVMGGIIEAGCHNEFTVVGDAVNVAQRLQAVAKVFQASLVVSIDLLGRITSPLPDVGWRRENDVEIPGRSLPLDVAYISELKDVAPDDLAP